MPKEPTGELHLKYRPKKLGQVIGQEKVVAVLEQAVKTGRIPHAAMFVGPSGCGKTTVARILVKKLRVGTPDFIELNAADARGIDDIRRIRSNIYLSPIAGKKKAFVIDEAQGMTKDAQNALLKVLEEPPPHAYIFICTTDPGKIIPAVKTRCKTFRLTSVDAELIADLVMKIATAEAMEFVTEAVCRQVAEAADGWPRKALHILEQVGGMKSEEEILDSIYDADTEKVSIDLARLLLNRKLTWNDVASTLKDLYDEPETVRRIVLAYATAVCLGGVGHAAWVMECFKDPIYQEGKAAKSLLVLYCWNACHPAS